MNYRLVNVPQADRKPAELRAQCARISGDEPEMIVTGLMMFGKFATVHVADELTGSIVRSTELGGYWKAGEFQLFTAAELALDEESEDL
jgi:hypothetical protein